MDSTTASTTTVAKTHGASPLCCSASAILPCGTSTRGSGVAGSSRKSGRGAQIAAEHTTTVASPLLTRVSMIVVVAPSDEHSSAGPLSATRSGA